MTSVGKTSRFTYLTQSPNMNESLTRIFLDRVNAELFPLKEWIASGLFPLGRRLVYLEPMPSNASMSSHFSAKG
jgi:hypothetical protein